MQDVASLHGLAAVGHAPCSQQVQEAASHLITNILNACAKGPDDVRQYTSIFAERGGS